VPDRLERIIERVEANFNHRTYRAEGQVRTEVRADDADTLCRALRLALKCARHKAFCPKGKVYAVDHPMHGRKIYCDEACGYDELQRLIGGGGGE